jgi:hypothetical protein
MTKTNKHLATTCKTLIFALAFLSFFMQKSFGQSVTKDLSQHSKTFTTVTECNSHKQSVDQAQVNPVKKQSPIKVLQPEKKLVVTSKTNSKIGTQKNPVLTDEAVLKNNELIAIPENTNKTKTN